MKKIIVLSILLICSNIALSQLQMYWQQCYGGSEYEEARDIVQVKNGYLVMGSTPSTDGDVSYNHGGGDYWIVRIDSIGNILWDKSFGGSSGEFLYNGFYAQNSNEIYLVGHSGSTDGDISFDPYNGATNLWVAKIDTAGNILWDRKVGSPIGLIYDKLAIPASDGGVVMAAQICYPGGDVTNYYGGYDGWIIKLDSLGETVWDFSAGTSEFEFINSVMQTSDGGYLAGLSGMSNGVDGNIDCSSYAGSPDAIIYKIKKNGYGEWSHCYGGSGVDGITATLELEDGYLLAGYGGSNDGDLAGSGWHGQGDIWILKVDPDGNIIWQKCYGGSSEEYPVKLLRTPDDNFLIFGITQSINGDVVGNPSTGYRPSIWAFKIDDTGELLWQQCIGGVATERVYGVTPVSDNYYVVAGEMTYSPSGDVNCSNYVWDSGSNYWAFMVKDLTVGIAESPDPYNVKIYPNPATSVINIELPGVLKIEKYIIELIDITGRTVLILNPESSTSSLDIKHVDNGLYLIKIQCKKSLILKKIIIL